MTDKEILDRIYKTADSEEFREIINRYQEFIYKKSYLFSLGDKKLAEELAIAIFLDIWNKTLKHQYTEPINRWVSSITIKLGYEQYKKLKKN